MPASRGPVNLHCTVSHIPEVPKLSQDNFFLAIARREHTRGRAIFPCVPWNKQPLVDGGHRSATRDMSQIVAWSEAYPEANVGYVPGGNHELVIDLDEKPDGSGFATWCELHAAEGQLPTLTRTMRTPSGGLQLYYRGEIPFKGTVSKLGKYIDTRGAGSYVLAEGCRVRYQDGREGTYTLEVDEPAADLPGWIVKRFERLKANVEARVAAATELSYDSPLDVWNARNFIKADHEWNGQPRDGMGSDDRAYRMAERLGDLALSPTALVELMCEWAPHFDRDWLEGKVNNAIAYRQNGLGCDRIMPASEVHGDIVRLMCLADPKKHADRFRWYSMSDLASTENVPFWDEEKMLPRYADGGGVMMVFGPPNSNKTNVLLTKIFDLLAKPEEDRPRIVYSMGEGRGGLGQRVRAHVALRALEGFYDADKFRAIMLPSVNEEPEFGEWRRMVCEYAPDILIVDTLATTLNGMEEDTEAAALLTRNGKFGKIAEELNCLVMVVHHTGWDPVHERGTSGFRGNVCATLAVYANADQNASHCYVHAVRIKDGRDGQKVYYELDRTQGGVPVPVLTTKFDYDQSTLDADKKTRAPKDFDRGEVEGAITAACGEAPHATSELVAMHMLAQQKGEDPEEWTKRYTRVARRLERVADVGVLQGLFRVKVGWSNAWPA